MENRTVRRRPGFAVRDKRWQYGNCTTGKSAGGDSFTYADPAGTDGWQAAWSFTVAAPVTYSMARKLEYSFTLQDYLARQTTPAFLREPPPDGAYVTTAGYRPE